MEVDFESVFAVTVWCEMKMAAMTTPFPNRTRLVLGDGLTAIGVGALGWIEGGSALSEYGQMVPGLVQGLDMSIQFGQVALQEIDNMVTRSFAVSSKVEDRRYLHQRETRRLSVTDKPEPIDSFVAVVPVSVVGPIRLG